MSKPISIEVWNPSGRYRVISTKSMPGTRWIRLLTDQDCRVEVMISSLPSVLPHLPKIFRVIVAT